MRKYENQNACNYIKIADYLKFYEFSIQIFQQTMKYFTDC